MLKGSKKAAFFRFKRNQVNKNQVYLYSKF